MLKRILITAVVIGVITVVALYFVYNKPHRTVDEVEATVSAESLVNAFDQNETDANNQFLDKVIEVKGKVKEVIEQNDSFIVLIGDDASISNVSCTLDHKQDSVAYGLKKGDEVIVRGICTGFLLDVVLVNCKVISEGGNRL